VSLTGNAQMPIGRPGRREVLVAGAASVVALSLPGAASASSYVAALSSAVVYDAGDMLLAGWSGTNTSTATFPITAGTRASTFVSDGGTGVQSYGGTEAANYTALLALARGIVRDNDGRNWWYLRNTDNPLDTAAAGVPYVQYSITAGTKLIRLSSFFLGALATGSAPISIRVSNNGYATALREGPGPSSYSNYVVNLAGLPLIQPGATMRLRIYTYDTTHGSLIIPGGNYPAFDASRDAYNSLQSSRSAGFIGRLITPS
jgi:hypothetical protein